MTPRRLLARAPRPPWWLLPLCLVILVGTYLITTNRWQIGRRAVAIVDPSVRAWATREVARLSDGAYLLTASTIQVDEARRRVAIDTITVTTDTTVNARRKTPLPQLALRFRNCALEGVDLDQLASRRGLHVNRVGCDSVSVMVDVPAALASAATAPAAAPGQGFLNFQQQLDLPGSIPLIAMDTIAFPQLKLVLSIATASGRRTNITFDRLGVQFDSLEYERRGRAEEDRVLLSRDVRLVLERFEGSREATSHLALRLLSASLSRGTLRLDSLAYKPLPGGFADSLGLTELRVGHLGLDGIDWRRFLTTGDIQVGMLTLDTAMVRLPNRSAAPSREKGIVVAPAAAPSLETTLRALDRVIRLDSFAARHLTFINDGPTARDSSATSVARITATNLGFDNADSSWTDAFPLGRVLFTAEGIVHAGSGDRFTVDRVDLDVPAGTAVATGMRSGPEGNDDAFFRRLRYRRDRVSLAVDTVRLLGLDVAAYLRRGEPRVRSAQLTGFSLDVLSDKRKPVSPTRSTHDYPQEFLRALGVAISIDTVTVRGGITYRERGADAPAPGVLEFRDLKAMVTGLRATPGAAPADSTPLHVVADARLMGAGRLQLDLTIPLQAFSYQMRYHGSLSSMRAEALNPFLGDAIGMRFTAGTIDGIRFEATVDKGRARGTLQPRWTGLKVELPGVARKSGGLLGGIRRAVAKFAANTFVIRGDNPAGPEAKNGVIDHRWATSETLPRFLWVSLREALLPILKK